MIKKTVKQLLGEDLLKIATVQVSWAEGSKKDNVELSYLIANQNGIDQTVEGLSLPKELTNNTEDTKKPAPPKKDSEKPLEEEQDDDSKQKE